MINKLLILCRLRDKNDNCLGCPYLSDAALEKLTQATAERTIEMLENKMYLRIGKGVVHKLLWLTGFATISVLAWLHSKGII